MAQAFADANKAYFDQSAAEYDTRPWHRALTIAITEELQKELTFIGADWINPNAHTVDASVEPKQVRLLDYACGGGMVTQAFKKCVTQSLGVDISPNMVRKYNAAMRAAGLPPAVAHAVEGDLLTPETVSRELSTPELHDFDIVAVGLGFHHFDSPALTVQRLAQRLKPGGVLLIIDLVADGDAGSFKRSKAGHTIKTHGFTEEGMKKLFEAEGLVDVGWHVMEGRVELGVDEHSLREKQVFFGRAQKKRA